MLITSKEILLDRIRIVIGNRIVIIFYSHFVTFLIFFLQV